MLDGAFVPTSPERRQPYALLSRLASTPDRRLIGRSSAAAPFTSLFCDQPRIPSNLEPRRQSHNAKAS